MLDSLHVKNLTLIEEEEISFDPGMNVLTGETGAGKSVLIGSILLALGAKADKDVIRRGAEYAQIELGFTLDRENQRELCREFDIPLEEDYLLLSRRITPGKSISRANGEVVNQKQLKALADLLIDIHGQREHTSLLRKEKLRELLDSYAGEELMEKLQELKQLLPEKRRLSKELSDAEGQNGKLKRELDYARFSTEEILKADIKEGEEEELTARFRRMEHGKKIRENVALAMELLEAEGGVLDSLSRAEGQLSQAEEYDDALSEYRTELSSAEEQIAEAKRGLAGYLSDADFSEEEFASVSERLSLVQELTAKYGGSFRALQEYLENSLELIGKLEDYDGYVEGLKDQLSLLDKQIGKIGAAVSKARKQAAKELVPKLTETLRALNFLDVRLEIAVDYDPEEMGENGADKVDFLICVNPGESLKPLSEVASGGEISRIMLGLKSVFADKDDIPTLIFDEIDTGISGQTAWKVAERMGELSGKRQILCITHLPQIAAMGDRHFYVEKEAEKNSTRTGIRTLSDTERPGELSRMFGGEKRTDSALRSAEEMLTEASEFKKKTIGRRSS